MAADRLRILDLSRPVCVALSGGVDSMALLHLVAQWGNQNGVQPTAIHVHHGLSENADGWAEHCRNQADLLGISLRIVHVILDLNSGESIENLARQARYQAFAKTLAPNSQIVLAHHADDQLETVLLALKRGSGLTRLQGMSPIKALPGGMTLVRPFLNMGREEIVRYALENGIEWVEDESNKDVRYDRNFLRHTVAPLLKSRWPGLLSAIQRSCEITQSENRALTRLVQKELAAALDEEGNLQISTLDAMEEDVRSLVIREWLRTQGVEPPRNDRVSMIYREVARCRPDRRPLFTLKGAVISRRKGVLVLTTRPHHAHLNEGLSL